MARLIEFSRRSTNQLQKILTFYDERNGSDVYSRRLLKCLLDEVNRIAINNCVEYGRICSEVIGWKVETVCAVSGN